MLETTFCSDLNRESVGNYFNRLINKVFRILPLIEEGEKSITVYIDSLQDELDGYRNLVTKYEDDPDYISLLSVIVFIKDNHNSKDVAFAKIRREVFNAINLCCRMRDRLLDCLEESAGGQDG